MRLVPRSFLVSGIAVFFLTAMPTAARAHDAGAPRCSVFLGESRTWGPGFFTEPRKHTDDDYRYLVHAIPEWRLEHASIAWIYDQMPASIALSTSLIDESLNPTWSPVGFIFAAPKTEQILVTSGGDAMTPRFKRPKNWLEKFLLPKSPAEIDAYREKLLRQFSGSLIQSPAELLGSRSPFMHNEVLVGGSELTGTAMPKVIGIFYKLGHGDGKPEIGESVRQGLERLARKKNLPLIPLRDTGSGR
jgi:hypothetical protein